MDMFLILASRVTKASPEEFKTGVLVLAGISLLITLYQSFVSKYEPRGIAVLVFHAVVNAVLVGLSLWIGFMLVGLIFAVNLMTHSEKKKEAAEEAAREAARRVLAAAIKEMRR